MTLRRSIRNDLQSECCIFKASVFGIYSSSHLNVPYFNLYVSLQVAQLSLAAGVVRPLQPNKEIMLNDSFFLGGPLTLRGFNNKGVGPHTDGRCSGVVKVMYKRDGWNDFNVNT